MFSKFLHDAPPDDPNRAPVAEMLRELDRAVSETTPASPPAPAQVPPKAPPEVGLPSVALTATPTARAPRSGFRRYWWTLPLAVVAAAGLSVGIYFGARPRASTCLASDPDCFNFRR
jgi:hypothetical protein